MDDIQLFQGDCLEVMKQIPDGSVDMVLADPPYGTTACKWDSVIPFEPMWEQLKRVIKPNGAIVLCGAQPFTSALIMSNIKMFKQHLIWEKTNSVDFALSKIRHRSIHEDCILFGSGRVTYNPQMLKGDPYTDKPRKRTNNVHNSTMPNLGIVNEGTRYPRSVFKFSNGNNGNVHPTQKPVALMEYLIKTYTNEGETALDFTMGSGTTGVSCVNTGRKFIGIELDEKYFNIAKNRINETTTNRP